ncbi:BTB/POZ domain-containing protein [Drosera capensis]
MADNKVETISRVAQWRIDNFGPCTYKKSDPFKIGIWNWYLSIEKSRHLLIRLYPEPSRVAKEQPPLARFIITVSNPGLPSKSYASPITERLIRNSDDFVWSVDFFPYGRFVIDVEFVDLKICTSNVGDTSAIWPSDGPMQTLASESSLRSLSRMLHEGIHADVTIKTGDGSLKAHKAILAASSPVFQSMFHHDLKEKESSIIEMEDMNQDSCMALLSYLYGTITPEEFWMHRVSLLGAANKYDITGLKKACEESLLEDINTGNVLVRLQEAWLFKLDKLKKGCFKYLVDFGKVYDIRDQLGDLFMHADRELMLQMFNEVLVAWRPGHN